MNKIRWYNHKNTTYEEFSIKDGFVYTDNLSEQLDSAVIVLNKIDKKNFEPFDIVEIRFGTDVLATKTMLIDNFIETQVSFNPVKYDYTLNLMSNTKRLERTIIPNCSFTKPKGQDAITLADAIDYLLEDYSPKFLNQSNGWQQLFTLNIGTRLVLHQTKCPDIYIGKGTLRNAIDKILSVINCICYLNYDNEIGIVNINKKGSEIDLTKLNYINSNQSSSDYASTLDNQYNNIVNTRNTNIRNYVSIKEYIGFRNTNGGILDTDSMELLTTYPIYDIKSFKVCCVFGINTIPNTTWVEPYTYYELELINEFDNTKNRLVEKQIFDTLDYDIKNKTLFYSRGVKNINGSGTFKYFYIFNLSKLENVILQAYNDSFDIVPKPYSRIEDIDTKYERYMFKVEYYTQVDNIRAKSGKYLPETNENNEIIDNPGEVYVDIQQQGKLFNEKCNRLGNRIRYINGRYLTTDTLPQLGDTIGDFVLINREITYFDNFILFKGTLAENFVNINYFTGINARKRSWQIVSSSEAFDKQLIDKYYCELSFSEKRGADTNNSFSSCEHFALNLLETPFNQRDISYVKHLTVEGFYDLRNADGTYTDNQKYHYELELNSYIAGNSIIFHSDFFDNYASGIQITTSTTGGWKENWLSYVDKYGRNYSNSWFHYTLIRGELNINEGLAWNPLLHNQSSTTVTDFWSKHNNMVSKSHQFPRLLWENTYKQQLINNQIIFDLTNSNYLVNHKDSREKIGLNIQFEFCSDTNNLIIGPSFIEREQLISRLTQTHIRIFASTTESYKYGGTEGNGTELDYNLLETTFIGLSSTKNTAHLEIRYNGTRFTEYKSVGLCDINGKLILGINKTIGEDIPDVYLNILKTRDRNKYSTTSLKNWI